MRRVLPAADLPPPRATLSRSQERLARFVTEALKHRPMEALERALAVVATDAQSGALTVFNRGDPGLAVRASSSVPRLFVPPLIGGREYLDGALVSPVPVKLACAMGADVVIAVDISRVGGARFAAQPDGGNGSRGGGSRASPQARVPRARRCPRWKAHSPRPRMHEWMHGADVGIDMNGRRSARRAAGPLRQA